MTINERIKNAKYNNPRVYRTWYDAVQAELGLTALAARNGGRLDEENTLRLCDEREMIEMCYDILFVEGEEVDGYAKVDRYAVVDGPRGKWLVGCNKVDGYEGDE